MANVYYQPDFKDDATLITPKGVELWSYYVYQHKKNAQRDFPDREILEYTEDDIENPVFIDDYSERMYSEEEIRLMLKELSNDLYDIYPLESLEDWFEEFKNK